MGSAWVEGGGGKQDIQGPPSSYRVWRGEGRREQPSLFHADLSFSYLRFAEAASFDKKELRRSCTKGIDQWEKRWADSGIIQ